MRKGGQASTEYLIFVVFVMILVLPGVYIFFNSSELGREDDAQIQHFAQAVLSQSERLYSMGPGARAVINEQLPEGIASIGMKSDSATGKYELIIATDGWEYSFACPVPIRTSFSSGAIGGEATVILATVQEATGEVYVSAAFLDNFD